LDNLVQLVEACVPKLAIPLDPRRLFFQPARAELAGPHAPDLLRGDEPGLLQDADVLLHAREGHVEPLGKVRDRSVGTAEPLHNAASGGVRERGERGIEAGLRMLNHLVQYTSARGSMQGEAERGLRFSITVVPGGRVQAGVAAVAHTVPWRCFAIAFTML